MLDAAHPSNLPLPRPFDEAAAHASTIMERWRSRIQRRNFHAAAHNLSLAAALDASSAGGELLRRSRRCGLSDPNPGALWAALERLTGANAPMRVEAARQSAALRLAEEARAVFGRAMQGRASPRVIATLSPATAETPDGLAELLLAGVSCVRINTARDSKEGWRNLARAVRGAARATGRPCRVLVDLPGPKLRLADADDVRLREGDAFGLLEHGAVAPQEWAVPSARLPVSLAQLKPGMELAIDDGRLVAAVEVCAAGALKLRVQRTASRKGVRLRNGRGIHIPEVLVLDHAEPNDAVAFAATEADIVGLSFLRGPADVVRLRSCLAGQQSRRVRQALMLKIETSAALDTLPDILVEAAGVQPTAVMIARGDLLSAVGPANLPSAQARILHFAAAAQLPVIGATGVLEGTVKTGIATRSELLDAAALVRSAQGVMLNRGRHQVTAAKLLRAIAGNARDELCFPEADASAAFGVAV